MNFFSTNKKSQLVSPRDAVLQGLADDGGLFMPCDIPHLPEDFFASLPKRSFHDIAFEISKIFFDDVPHGILQSFIAEAFNFPVPLVSLDKSTFVLELFHGPTLAFKDFAARFMARLMAFYIQSEGKPLTVLVATSGDTGSAVAHGFFRMPGISVTILYPKGKVTEIQEKQLTTMGENITALEVDGTFDDCQRLVKQAFLDSEIRRKKNLASANSINIGRLIPQTFYYFAAYGELIRRFGQSSLPMVCSVPSGNFGNLTAGLFAKRMGLSIHRFIAATNANDVVPRYLKTGVFTSRPSQETLSNAMDIGNPSNFVRMLELYDHDVAKMREDIFGAHFSDEETKDAMRRVYKQYGYILEPHGAIGYLGLEAYRKEFSNTPQEAKRSYRAGGLRATEFVPRERGSLSDIGIFVETAHPVKFSEIVQEVLHSTPEIPERLQACLQKEKQSISLPNDFSALKTFLCVQ